MRATAKNKRVIPALVAGIHRSTDVTHRGEMGPGDTHRDDSFFDEIHGFDENHGANSTNEIVDRVLQNVDPAKIPALKSLALIGSQLNRTALGQARG
ncbi:MAG: hypothetical protein ACR2OV_17325 [Hyphomicrobiaceae bacterium]